MGRPPRKLRSNQPGDGGFTSPRVFDTIEEAVAAGTSEDRYLDELDRPEDDDADRG